MSWEVELAKEFNKRNNQAKIGAVLGTVLGVNPLKIGILNNQILLDSSNSYICSNLVEQYTKKANISIDGTTISNYNAELIYKEILHVGDKVLVIATDDNQTFFIIDKLI